MRVYRIVESRAGGLRLLVLEDGVELAGAVAPTRGRRDRRWLEEVAAGLGAVPAHELGLGSAPVEQLGLGLGEGGADAKSPP